MSEYAKYHARRPLPPARPFRSNEQIREKGFFGALHDAYMLDTSAGQLTMFAATANAYGVAWAPWNREVEEGYNAFVDDDLTGFESYPNEFARSTSRAETAMIKQMIRNNQELRTGVEDHGFVRFTAGLLDPINVLPVGRATGLGFWKGAEAIAAPGGVALLGSEAARHAIDPTSTYMETVVNVLGGTLFMGLMGGVVGKINPKTHASVGDLLNRMVPPPGQVGMSIGIPFIKGGGGGLKRLFKKINDTLEADVGQKGMPLSEAQPRAKYKIHETTGADDKTVVMIEHEDVGLVMVAEKEGKWFRVSSVEVPEANRRQGIGIGAYKLLISHAEDAGKRVVSDFQTTKDAQKVWKALEDEGYNIHKNEDVKFDDEGRMWSEDGNPNYQVKGLLEDKGIPQKMIDDYDGLKSALKFEQTRNVSLREDLAALEAELPNKSKAGGAATKHKQKMAEVKDGLKTSDKMVRLIQSEMQNLDVRMALTLSEKTIKDWDLLPTGYVGMLGKLNEFPWFRMIRTPLRELAPDLAVKVQLFAYKMGGTPGLNNLGNRLNHTSGPSVEMFSLIHHGKLAEAMKGANNLYMKYMGLGEAASTGRVVVMDMAQRASSKVRRLAGDTTADSVTRYGKMTKQEWNRQVSHALANNGAHDIPEVAQAAQFYLKHMNEMADEGRKLGIFSTQRNIQRRLDKAKVELERLQKVKKRLIEGKLKPEEKNIEPITLQQEIDNLILEIPTLEGRLTAFKEATRGAPGEAGYIHRLWLLDQVQAKEAEIKELLYKNFTENLFEGNHVFYMGGRQYVVKADDPAAIRARVNEAYNSIMREAEMGGAADTIHDPNKRHRLEKRLEELERELEVVDFAAQGQRIGLTPDIKEIGVQVEIVKKKLRMYQQGSEPMASGALLSRELDLDDRELLKLGVIESDVEAWMSQYTTRMAPLIETARMFGDAKASKYINDTLAEIHVRAAEETDPDKAAKLLKEAEELRTAMTDFRDIVQGFYQIPDDPSAITGRVLRFLRNINIPATMGRSVIAAWGDVGNTVVSQGFVRTFRFGLERMKSGLEGGNIRLIDREVELAGSVTEVLLALRYAQLAEMGPHLAGMTRWERGASHMAQRFFLLNLLGPWTDMSRRWAGGLAQSEIIFNSVKWVNGKLDAADQEKMLRLGINKEQAKQFATEWEASGSLKHNEMFIANTTNWVSDDAIRTFRAALNTEIMRMIPTPGAVDKPKSLLKSEWWKVIGQYRGFSIGATHRIFGAAMHTPGGSKYAGIASMIGISFMTDLIVRRPDYIEMDLEDQILRAVELSGVTGILLDFNDTLERATAGGFGIRPALGMDIRERNPNWANRLGVVGAVPNSWLTLMHAFMADDATGDDQARAIRYMLPYNNLLYWNDFVTRMQRGAGDTLEEWQDD